MSTEPIISFIAENDEEIRKLFDDAKDKVSDLRIPFGLIANNWYQGNKKIFSLKGPGLYTDLSAGYKIQKKRAVGFYYPILKRTGALERSLISKNDSKAVSFVGRQELVLGTSVDYGIYHQSDEPRAKIPQRKFIFIDGGANEVAKDAIIAGRVENWTNIMSDYIRQVLSGDAG